MGDDSYRLTVSRNDPELEDGSVDELVMADAHVHLEDMGDCYSLIVQNEHRRVDITIPARKRRKAFVFELTETP